MSNPIHKGQVLQGACKYCSKTFSYVFYKKYRSLCSKECLYQSLKGPVPEPKGPVKPIMTCRSFNYQNFRSGIATGAVIGLIVTAVYMIFFKQ